MDNYFFEPWHKLELTIPAMKFPVKTKNKITKKTENKKDAFGTIIYSEKIVPKERPRFNSHTGHAHSAPNTVAFEKHIRQQFFKQYPSNNIVKTTKGMEQVGRTFLGCKQYGNTTPCYLFKQGFKDCKTCKYRRKNLKITTKVFLIDDRHIDLDNVLKIILDALEHVCFYNDSQFAYKQIELIPFAQSERIESVMETLPVEFSDNSLKHAYAIRQLPMKLALTYIQELFTYKIVSLNFFNYINRSEKRKAVIALVDKLTKDMNE